MADRRRRRRRCIRQRIGRVSIYLHHGAWRVYYREDDKPVRRQVGPDERAAERIAAEVNTKHLPPPDLDSAA